MKYWNPKRATIDGGLIFIRRESLLPFYYVVEILCMEVYFVINNGTFFYVYHICSMKFLYMIYRMTRKYACVLWYQICGLALQLSQENYEHCNNNKKFKMDMKT
jgi:hypothetical protein